MVRVGVLQNACKIVSTGVLTKASDMESEIPFGLLGTSEGGEWCGAGAVWAMMGGDTRSGASWWL